MIGKRVIGLAAAVVLTLSAMAGLGATNAVADPVETGVSSQGTEFWIAFDQNYRRQTTDLRYLHLFVSGAEGTTGTVTIAGLGFTETFTIPADGVATVDLPMEARGMESYVGATVDAPGARGALGVHVEASAPVTVYGINRQTASTDAYLALPVTALGQRYRLVDYYGTSSNGALMSVVATQDGTTFTVEPPAGTGETPFTKTLARGEMFEWVLTTAESLTGTVVSADKPISVFAGDVCTNVPTGYAACDHLIEQMIPTSSWGRTFVTYPLQGRSQDTFRILADLDATTVTIEMADGTTTTQTLAAGAFHEFSSSQPMTITSDKPVQVAQYSNGGAVDGLDNADPFMVLIAPYEQGFTESTFTTPTDAEFPVNDVNITAPTASLADVLLDGVAIPATDWVAIGASGYSGVSVEVAQGNHTLTAPVPVQAIVYGFGEYDSYGYPAGLRTARIAEISTLTLNPPSVAGTVGDQLCATASLLDSSSVGIAGANLTVTLTGATPAAAATVVTDANGQYVVCATATEPGVTTVTVVQGDLTVSGTLSWTAKGELIPPPVEVAPTGGTLAGASSPALLGVIGLLMVAGGVVGAGCLKRSRV